MIIIRRQDPDPAMPVLILSFFYMVRSGLRNDYRGLECLGLFRSDLGVCYDDDSVAY